MTRNRILVRAIGLAALLVTALWLSACKGDSAAPHLARAEQLVAAGKPEDALLELRNALKAEPKNAAVNCAIAQLLYRQRQIPDAVFFFEEALRLDPQHVEAALTLAFMMLGDDPTYSQRLVDGVLERDPKNALAWARRSDIALANGDADAALSAALTAAELEPDSARAQIQVGLVHRARIRKLGLLGEPIPDALFDEALAAFERSAKGKVDSTTEDIRVMAKVEIANTLGSWPARRSEAPAAYRAAFAFGSELGASQDGVIDAAIAYARAVKDNELRRWAVEQSIAIHPERIDLWQRLAVLTDAPDAERSEVLARMIGERASDASAHVAYARDLVRRGHAAEAIAHLGAVVDKVNAPEAALSQQVELALAANDEETARAAAARLAKEHSGTLEHYVAQAALLRRAQDFRGAADSLDAGIDAFGNTPALARELAELRMLQGDANAALEAAESGLGIATSPRQKLALLRIQARAQLARGAFDAAAASFRKMGEITQGRFATVDLVPYAQALYATKRESAGRAMLDIALGLPDPSLEAVILFSRLEGARDRERAERIVETALAKNAQHPALLEEAARFDLAAGRNDQARARLAAAVEAAPGYAPLRVTLARVLLQTGDAAGAVQNAEQAMQLDPSSPNPLAAQVLVASYTQLGKADEAVKRLQASHSQKKLGMGGRVLLARLLTAKGLTEPAIELLEGIVAEAPELPGPKNDLAYLLVTVGRDLDRALSLAQEARAALPTVGGVADTLGFAYLAKQLPAAALPQFDEAIALAERGSPEWGLAQLHRALALQALERREDARAAAEAALEAAAFPEQRQAAALLKELAKPV